MSAAISALRDDANDATACNDDNSLTTGQPRRHNDTDMTDTVEITRDAPLSASLQALTETYPDAPAAELRRFADARPNSQEDALALYAKYLAWREADGSAAALAEAAAQAASMCEQSSAT